MKKRHCLNILFPCILIGIGMIVVLCFNWLNKQKHNGNIFKYDEKYFLNLIEKNLDVLYEHPTLNLSDEVMTRWAYNHIEGLSSEDKFSASVLDDYIKNSPLKDVDYELTDIYNMFESYSVNDIDGIRYELKDGTYYSADSGGRGMAVIKPFYSKAESFKWSDNKYYISVKNIFYYSSYDGPVDIALYNSFTNIMDDIKNDGHFNSYDYVSDSSFPRSFAVFELDEKVDISSAYEKAEEEAKKYIIANWNKLKDYISTYNYIFKIVDNKPVLVGISENYSQKQLSKNYTSENITKGDLDYTIGQYLDILLEKKSLADLTDREMTNWLYRYYFQNADVELSNTKDLDAALKNSVFKNMKFSYTDIYDFYGNYDAINSYDKDAILIELLDNGIYSLIDSSGHGLYGIFPVYCESGDYKIKKNRYYISQKCVFQHYEDEGASIDALYATYESKSPFKTFTINEKDYEESNDPYNLAYEYIAENWGSIKDKLDSYNYVFEIEDGQLVLVDFNRVSK